MLYSGISLSGVLYNSLILKFITMLFWFCPTHAPLRGEPEICASSYTGLIPSPAISSVWFLPHFQPSGAPFLSCLARSIGFLGGFLLVLSKKALLAISPLIIFGWEVAKILTIWVTHPCMTHFFEFFLPFSIHLILLTFQSFQVVAFVAPPSPTCSCSTWERYTVWVYAILAGTKHQHTHSISISESLWVVNYFFVCL